MLMTDNSRIYNIFHYEVYHIIEYNTKVYHISYPEFFLILKYNIKVHQILKAKKNT